MRDLGDGSRQDTWRWIVAGLLAGLAIGIVIFFGTPGLGNTQASSPAQTSAPAEAKPFVGQPAPGFTTEDTDGKTISLSDYAGDVVLLNFWATWCGPCEIEMPHLQERFERFQPDGFWVLGVNFDEPRNLVASYGQENELTFPLVLDPGGEIQQLYRIRGYPSSYLVDRDGTIVDVHVGLMTEDRMDEMLAAVGLEG